VNSIILAGQEGGTHRMSYAPINFRQKLALFSEQWQPKVIAEITRAVSGPRGAMSGFEGSDQS
jgi:hypothetical protein